MVLPYLEEYLAPETTKKKRIVGKAKVTYTLVRGKAFLIFSTLNFKRKK